ncbi:unnamed protein product, partial [Iphiclides podalirius]
MTRVAKPQPISDGCTDSKPCWGHAALVQMVNSALSCERWPVRMVARDVSRLFQRYLVARSRAKYSGSVCRRLYLGEQARLRSALSGLITDGDRSRVNYRRRPAALAPRRPTGDVSFNPRCGRAGAPENWPLASSTNARLAQRPRRANIMPSPPSALTPRMACDVYRQIDSTMSIQWLVFARPHAKGDNADAVHNLLASDRSRLLLPVGILDPASRPDDAQRRPILDRRHSAKKERRSLLVGQKPAEMIQAEARRRCRSPREGRAHKERRGLPPLGALIPAAPQGCRTESRRIIN